MTGRYLLLCLVLIFSTADALVRIRTVNGRVRVTMGTSAGCVNAVNFIRDHLVPTYNRYRNFMDVEFVTWGRTQVNANGFMTCQFGQADCWANRVHRCAQNMLRGNTPALVWYMACEFTPPFPAFRQRSLECARRIGLNVAHVDNCARNTRFDALDRWHQNAAAHPMRVINWVPFVVFQNTVHLQAHRDAHGHFRRMVCQALLDDPHVPVRGC